MYAVCSNSTSADSDMWSSANNTISGEKMLAQVGGIPLVVQYSSHCGIWRPLQNLNLHLCQIYAQETLEEF